MKSLKLNIFYQYVIQLSEQYKFISKIFNKTNNSEEKSSILKILMLIAFNLFIPLCFSGFFAKNNFKKMEQIIAFLLVFTFFLKINIIYFFSKDNIQKNFLFLPIKIKHFLNSKFVLLSLFTIAHFLIPAILFIVNYANNEKTFKLLFFLLLGSFFLVFLFYLLRTLQAISQTKISIICSTFLHFIFGIGTIIFLISKIHISFFNFFNTKNNYLYVFLGLFFITILIIILNYLLQLKFYLKINEKLNSPSVFLYKKVNVKTKKLNKKKTLLKIEELKFFDTSIKSSKNMSKLISSIIVYVVLSIFLLFASITFLSKNFDKSFKIILSKDFILLLVETLLIIPFIIFSFVFSLYSRDISIFSRAGYNFLFINNFTIKEILKAKAKFLRFILIPFFSLSFLLTFIFQFFIYRLVGSIYLFLIVLFFSLSFVSFIFYLPYFSFFIDSRLLDIDFKDTNTLYRNITFVILNRIFSYIVILIPTILKFGVMLLIFINSINEILKLFLQIFLFLFIDFIMFILYYFVKKDIVKSFNKKYII